MWEIIPGFNRASQFLTLVNVLTICSGGSNGGTPGARPPWHKNFSISCSFFWKFCQNRMLALRGWLAPPPTGNPWSAHGLEYNLVNCEIEWFNLCLVQLAVWCIFFDSIPQACDEASVRCYWTTGIAQTWNNARTACETRGGNLAVMETQELWNFVLNKSASLG